MITSVTMVRKMGSFNVEQRTKDGYFDANALLTQWNSKLDNKRKNMSDFKNSKATNEFLEALNEEIAQTEISAMAIIEKKGRNTSKGRTKDEVWMHPYLFIDFAMWLNPKFKLQVIKFVYDQLIEQRTLAGDNYKTLSSSIVKLKGYSFQEVAKAIQWIVYNKTGKDLRQKATQEQLQEINDIQTKMAFAIDMNYITSYEQLLNELRKIYNKKYQKF